MAKRGYKLQEFVAHSGSVNCLKIGKKNFRQFITGGDDQVVNVWSIGKPEPVTSLSGHTSPVESVAFDSAEALVIAGASSGAIKLWDLEETKMVRTLSGHRSYCTAVEFHPFGEFFASGSMDTNLKIWDIRKKGCTHTYKGHTRGISIIRFTPDGRWVVSGGFDNVVKIWDLTAGKPLHDFKLHEGHIRSLDFHPLEFLLATGSADRTVKFWDLETFEMIGSARRENAGVRSITFHPDGRTLFCGLDDSLKVYSWEPVICHDSVDMGWSTLGDLCVHDGKLLGGAYYQNSVGVWVADIAFIEPYGGDVLLPDQNSHPEQKHELQENASKKSDSHGKSNSSMRSTSPDVDSDEIKNIYVDSCNPVTSTNVGSLNSPKTVVLPESKETTSLSSQKQRSAVGIQAKTKISESTKSFTVPTIVPRETPDAKDLASFRRESFAGVRASTRMVKPSHVRRPSITKSDVDNKSTSPEPLSCGSITSTADPKKDPNLNRRIVGNNIAKESSEEKNLSIKNIQEKSEKASSLARPLSQENGEKAQNNKGMLPVKVVNGVAVVRGRTRSLVERFEKKEGFNFIEAQTPDKAAHPTTEAVKTSPLVSDETPHPTIEAVKTSPPVPDKAPHPANEAVKTSPPVPGQAPQPTAEAVKMSPSVLDKAPHPTTEAVKMSPSVLDKAPHPTTEAVKMSPLVLDKAPHPTTEVAKTYHPNDNQLSAGREETAFDDSHVIEVLMQNHDVLLSAFRSRLTKLQVVRHFWERKDVKGAINAMRKLPDHSVQADVISVLIEKLEIINLDLFSSLLPVLLGLLDSKVERHVTVSLEMLLKLIAVFGPLVRSTVSAPRAIGVDLHAEQRLASCKECFVHLQNVPKILPTLIQRGGVVARCALELNLILQAP